MIYFSTATCVNRECYQYKNYVVLLWRRSNIHKNSKQKYFKENLRGKKIEN